MRGSQYSDSLECKDKMFYTIGDVAATVGVKQYVLRFWESKFPQINPVKRRGRRLYSKQDIEVIFHIKRMLYDMGYTIKGAKLALCDANKESPERAAKSEGVLADLIGGMVEIRDMISEKLGDGM